jgi:prevent-host-death family protein
MNGTVKEWQLQTAKNKFSEVVKLALAGEPQLVKKHGKSAVYVVSAENFENLTCTHGKLKNLLLNCPHKDVRLEVERPSTDFGREVDL